MRMGVHGHRRGGAVAAWARRPPEAWFFSFGRWQDERTVMGDAKDFQDLSVLGEPPFAVARGREQVGVPGLGG